MMNKHDKQRHPSQKQKHRNKQRHFQKDRLAKKIDSKKSVADNDQIPILSFLRQNMDTKQNLTSRPGSSSTPTTPQVHRRSKTVNSKISRSEENSKVQTSQVRSGWERPSSSRQSSPSPSPLASGSQYQKQKSYTNRKSSTSHTEMLKSLYVGDSRVSSPPQSNIDKAPQRKPLERKGFPKRVVEDEVLRRQQSSLSSSGRIHKHIGSPFQRNSKPVNKNIVKAAPSKVNFAFETSLNDIDLNLLTRARASSGGTPTSKGSAAVPAAPKTKNKTDSQISKIPNEIQNSNKSRISKANSPIQRTTTTSTIPSETKELSNMLSSRLKRRNVLFDKKSSVNSENNDKTGTSVKVESSHVEIIGSKPSHTHTSFMELPSIQATIADLAKTSSLVKENSVQVEVDRNLIGPERSRKNEKELQDLEAKTSSPAKESLASSPVGTPERKVPQLDLTSPSIDSIPAVTEKMDLKEVPSPRHPSSAGQAVQRSESSQISDVIQQAEGADSGTHHETQVESSEQNISKIIEKNDNPQETFDSGTFHHVNEKQSTEEPAKLLALSDTSSETSSDSSSSGHYVGDFQLLNTMKARMVGPKVAKWKAFNKSKFKDLMRYLIAEHTPLAARSDVSCSNDICNIRNYESVEVHHLQKLPPRLRYLELESPSNNFISKPLRANNRVEKLRKDELYNGSKQKRRTRGSAPDLEGNKKPLIERQIEDGSVSEKTPQEPTTSVPGETDVNEKVLEPIEDIEMLPAFIPSSNRLELDPNALSAHALPSSVISVKKQPSPTTVNNFPASFENGLQPDNAQPSTEMEAAEGNSTKGKDELYFDPEKCEDVTLFRKEYLALRASISKDNTRSSSLVNEDLNKTEVIQNLTSEIIQSEMKIASLVGINHQLREKLEELEKIQAKLVQELDTVLLESKGSFSAGTAKEAEVNNKDKTESINNEQAPEKSLTAAHGKLISKIEKDLVEIEALNKNVTERLFEIKRIKDREVENHPIIKQLRDTLEGERAHFQSQLALEKQKVSNLKAALLSRRGKNDINEEVKPAAPLDGKKLEELQAELSNTRLYARAQHNAAKHLQTECSTYRNLLSETKHKYNELNSKVALASKQCVQLRNTNAHLRNKLESLEGVISKISSSNTTSKLKPSSYDGRNTQRSTSGDSEAQQSLLNPGQHEQNGPTKLPKSNGAFAYIDENEILTKDILNDEVRKLNMTVVDLQRRIKTLTELETNVGPLSVFCEKEKLSIRDVVDRLHWIKRLESTIAKMANEKADMTAKVKDLETALNQSKEKVNRYEEHLSKSQKVDKPRPNGEDPVALKETIVRLLKERKKLTAILKNQAESKDRDPN
ncbi:Asf2 [Kluyveromyces lactis]|nr:Asf2 [Kluyveromyces lactis]